MDGSDHEVSDLGRRVAERREQSGLSRAEVSDRAGVSTGYLEYLETSAAPNPGPGTLARLAAALDTTAAALGGAGLNLPPGQRRAARRPVLEVLSPEQCREHLAAGGVGRFLFAADRGPVAIPVNYRVLGEDIVFCTGALTSVIPGMLQPRVSFDVDHIDDALSEGWSVLVSGEARLMTDPAELEKAAALGVVPWAGGDRDTYIRVVVRDITGRRIRATQ
jgi:nitroimidazol reductase NimA-like FMN-containing flavoprotein (pyridoxamine 5'-phosphate oxidase superfamily)